MLRTTILSLLALGASAAINNTEASAPPGGPIWRPRVGDRWQIVLKNSQAVDPARPAPFFSNIDIPIWDVDLFNTPAGVIQYLKNQGKKVMCYFSAGTAEDWRPDYRYFNPQDLGQQVKCWPGERWLNVRSPQVWSVVQQRIQFASRQGCDAIDPDNIDVFSNVNGYTQEDTIQFVRMMASEAHRLGMSIGLKNAEQILPQVANEVEFAVNEGCQTSGDCKVYTPFLQSGKPVFHIEYANIQPQGSSGISVSSSAQSLRGLSPEQIRQVMCVERSAQGQPIDIGGAPPTAFSTVIKTRILDGWVLYCDGTYTNSPTMNVNTGGPVTGFCDNS